jgi:hypothetical protein
MLSVSKAFEQGYGTQSVFTSILCRGLTTVSEKFASWKLRLELEMISSDG